MSKLSSPYAITLGTAGGPRWWPYRDQPVRAGISTAIVIDKSVYLVDCGYGAGRQLIEAGFNFDDLRAIFITHLHSDHIVDLASIALFSLYEHADESSMPVSLIGPGERGILPTMSTHACTEPKAIACTDPVPGTSLTFKRLVDAFSTDINERIFDALRPSPLDIIQASDIVLPSNIGFHPNNNPSPRMKPFKIYEDKNTAVTATLVHHPPMAPAFGYRFETDNGSVTISGDTAFSENLIDLANETNLLLHEAIDLEWLKARYGSASSAESQASLEHHKKSHTSIKDAVYISREANARKLALHHLVPGFSGPGLQCQSKTLKNPPSIPSDLDILNFCY